MQEVPKASLFFKTFFLIYKKRKHKTYFGIDGKALSPSV